MAFHNNMWRGTYFDSRHIIYYYRNVFSKKKPIRTIDDKNRLF